MMPDGTTLAERHGPASLFRPDVAADALTGLLASRKTLPAKLLYDDEGCRLFEAITDLPEYYVTRTETALLRAVAPAIAARLPSRLSVVEYSTGTKQGDALLAALDAPYAYAPIDVAPDAVNSLATRLSVGFSDLAILPVAADFMQPFALPAGIGVPRLGFFPARRSATFIRTKPRAFSPMRAACLARDRRFWSVWIYASRCRCSFRPMTTRQA